MSKFVNSTINNFNKKFIKISISQNNPNQLLFCFFKNINSNKDFIKSNAILFLCINHDDTLQIVNSFWHGISTLNKLIYIYFKHYNQYDVILPHISKNHFYYKYINIFIPENKILILNYKRKYEFNNIVISENIYHNYSFIPIYSKLYHNDILLHTKFIQREKTKDSFNGNLDISYKFLIDDSKFFSILDKFYHN